MQASIAGPMGLREWGLLLALSLLWGGSFFFNAVAVAALPVLTIVAVRVTLAAAILGAALAALGGLPPARARVWGALAVMAVLNNVAPFSLIVWGQQTLPSGVAAILNATTPLFTVLLAGMLTRDEPFTAARLVGAATGFFGVAVLIGPSALSEAGRAVAAELACLAAAVSYALSGIFGRRFRAMGLAPATVAAGQLAVASAILLPLAVAVDRPWTLPIPGPGVIAALVCLAALSTALAYLLFFRLLAAAGATNTSLVTLLVPVSAILLGASLLGETLAPRHLVGLGLIGLGLAAIDGRPLAALRRRSAP